MAKYLPVNRLTPGRIRRLQSGQVAFVPSLSAWVLVAGSSEEELWLVELTGDDSLAMHRLDVGDDGLALLLPEVRLEVDPTSARNGQYNRLMKSDAFQVGDLTGIGAMPSGARPHYAASAVALTGDIVEFDRRSPISYYSRWRLVTGNEDALFVICTVEALHPTD